MWCSKTPDLHCSSFDENYTTLHYSTHSSLPSPYTLPCLTIRRWSLAVFNVRVRQHKKLAAHRHASLRWYTNKAIKIYCSVEESQNLTTCVFSNGLVMIHNSQGSGEHQGSEMARWQQVGYPLLHSVQWHVEARADDTAFVQAAAKLNNNFTSSSVINNLKLTNVSLKWTKIQRSHP